VRRSSIIILSIMMVAFGAIMAAGGSALRPLAEDANASKVLTRQFKARGDLVEGTKVRLSRLPAAENRLAREGRGLVILMEPSPQVTARRGGLRLLALRAAQEALSRFPGQALAWVEIGYEIRATDGTPRKLRALLDASSGEGAGEPTPAFPVQLGKAPQGKAPQG